MLHNWRRLWHVCRPLGLCCISQDIVPRDTDELDVFCKSIKVYVRQKLKYSLVWQRYCKNKTMQFFDSQCTWMTSIIQSRVEICNNFWTRMCANAQCDGRTAEYKWRHLFNAAKFGWRPLLECNAVTLPRRETRWNLLGRPKLANRSQPLVGRSSPYCKDMWRRHCCFMVALCNRETIYIFIL